MKETSTVEASLAPELLGFRLGMSREQIESRFSGISIKDSHFLYPKKTLRDNQAASVFNDWAAHVNTSHFPEFSGVTRVRLWFNEGNLHKVEATYQDASAWKTEDDFVSDVAQRFHLPERQQWQDTPEPPYGKGASFMGKGFRVWAGFEWIGEPTVIAHPRIVIESLAGGSSDNSGEGRGETDAASTSSGVFGMVVLPAVCQRPFPGTQRRCR